MVAAPAFYSDGQTSVLAGRDAVTSEKKDDKRFRPLTSTGELALGEALWVVAESKA